MVRRGHPFDGWELAVLRRRRAADGQLQLWVELPDGRERAMPAAWTSLEAPPEDLPRSHGRASDYAALLKLVEALEQRCRGKDGQHARAAGDPAGAAAARGAHGTWESLPTADRESLLDQLARLLLRAAEEEAVGDEPREAD